MGRRPTRAADNPFCRARLEAAKYNDKLFSKEGASEMLGISTSTLSDYELGITKTVPPDMVLKMSDLYRTPELINIYCRCMCPLGGEMPEIELADLDRVTVRILSAFRRIGETREILLNITEDGVIDEKEKPELEKVLKNLEEMERITQSMKLWVKKNL